jgi:hypothetical protein
VKGPDWILGIEASMRTLLVLIAWVFVHPTPKKIPAKVLSNQDLTPRNTRHNDLDGNSSLG